LQIALYGKKSCVVKLEPLKKLMIFFLFLTYILMSALTLVHIYKSVSNKKVVVRVKNGIHDREAVYNAVINFNIVKVDDFLILRGKTKQV